LTDVLNKQSIYSNLISYYVDGSIQYYVNTLSINGDQYNSIGQLSQNIVKL